MCIRDRAYYEDIDASQYPNFKIEVGDWRTSDSVEYGRVISQTPDAERTVKVGTTILLTVSSGVSSDTMPPLVNQTVQAAQTALNLSLIHIWPRARTSMRGATSIRSAS